MGKPIFYNKGKPIYKIKNGWTIFLRISRHRSMTASNSSASSYRRHRLIDGIELIGIVLITASHFAASYTAHEFRFWLETGFGIVGPVFWFSTVGNHFVVCKAHVMV